MSEFNDNKEKIDKASNLEEQKRLTITTFCSLYLQKDHKNTSVINVY